MNEILIRKAKKGDKDAFCRLMDEQMQSMYKLAISYVKNAEDDADPDQQMQGHPAEKKSNDLYRRDAGNAFS